MVVDKRRKASSYYHTPEHPGRSERSKTASGELLEKRLLEHYEKKFGKEIKSALVGIDPTLPLEERRRIAQENLKSLGVNSYNVRSIIIRYVK